MRNQSHRRVLTVMILIVLYLVILLAGGFLVSYYPIHHQKEYVIGQAVSIASATEETIRDAIEETSTGNIYIEIYDTAGTVQYFQGPSQNLYYADATRALDLQHYLSTVAKKSPVLRLYVSYQRKNLLPDIMLVAGAAMERDGETVGTVFVVKNMMDVPYSLFGYVIYCTAFYWIVAVVFLQSRRRKAHLQQLEKQYIANMTHALKTPIASIKALSETLCEEVEPDPVKQQQYNAMILSEANHQSLMIQDILDLSRLQSMMDPPPKERCFIVDLFAPVWTKYQELVDCIGIEFQIPDCVQELPAVWTNPGYAVQIMEILLDNAVKFVQDDGMISVGAEVSGRKVILCVKDNGVGIQPEHLPHIFEYFYKSGGDMNPQGSGLGLAIAKEICDKMKEKIWVESQPGQGASFFFTLEKAR